MGDQITWFCRGHKYVIDETPYTVDEFEDGSYRVWCCPACGQLVKVEKVGD